MKDQNPKWSQLMTNQLILCVCIADLNSRSIVKAVSTTTTTTNGKSAVNHSNGKYKQQFFCREKVSRSFRARMPILIDNLLPIELIELSHCKCKFASRITPGFIKTCIGQVWSGKSTTAALCWHLSTWQAICTAAVWIHVEIFLIKKSV